MPGRSPLLIRPGTRYACHGDGVCCSDIHALGPLTRGERERVVTIAPHAVIEHPRLGLPVLATTREHRCFFLEKDGACRVHREHGADAKPSACRRFPLSAVRTPLGIRVVTAHRCPCRTMGERPLLDVEAAREALTTRGRLVHDDESPTRIPLTRKRRVGFDAYARAEAQVFTWLASETCATDRAARDTLPELEDMAWLDVAHAYRSMVDGTTTGEALGWFGDALFSIVEGRRLTVRARPWSFAFNRASARSTSSDRRPDALFADFASDDIYSLRWAHEGSLGIALAQLAVALTCASRVALMLERSGTSVERAAAEAVLVAEVGLSGPLGYARFTADVERDELARCGL